METNNLFIHPFIRLLFLCGGIGGAILINNPLWLLGFYVCLILPLFVFSGQIKKHIGLLLFGMFPILLSFVFLYIIVLKSSNGGWDFVFLKSLKLTLFTSIIQLTLTIPSENLITTFKKWGLKGEALITLLGAFTVWTDVNFRANKIITARFARGFIGERTAINKAKQFPFVLVPLIIGILRTSTERAESWEQKNILYLIEMSKADDTNYPRLLNVFLLIASVNWLMLGIFQKQIL